MAEADVLVAREDLGTDVAEVGAEKVWCTAGHDEAQGHTSIEVVAEDGERPFGGGQGARAALAGTWVNIDATRHAIDPDTIAGEWGCDGN